VCHGINELIQINEASIINRVTYDDFRALELYRTARINVTSASLCMEPINNNHRTSHPLANSPHFVRVTRAQWKAEQAERYKFAFVPKIAKSHGNR
jgi:hypothetical protein